ncbi:glycosyltransferase family 4 protein [Odoribacter laneus]
MKVKSKVLLLSPLPPPFGGIASWSKNLLSYSSMKKKEYLFHLNTAIKSRRITDLSYFSRLVYGSLDTGRIFFLFMKKVIGLRPRVVHVTTSASMGLFRDILFLWITKIVGIKSIFHFRFGRIPALSEIRNWEWKLLRYLIVHASSSIVIDRPSYQALCKEGLTTKIVCIPNPCSQEIEQIAHQEISEKQPDHYVFVGHVIVTKGVYELVRAFVLIDANLQLTLIGPYEETIKKELSQIASAKDNGHWLKFAGSQSKEEIFSVLQTATALVLPTYTEGFPNVVLEAMACGCPVLASSVAAIPDMLNQHDLSKACGICFKSKSVEEIIHAMNKFRSDPLKHKFYAINGKNKVLSEYTMDIVFPLYEKIWTT